jgi:hypothetical protein
MKKACKQDGIGLLKLREMENQTPGQSADAKVGHQRQRTGILDEIQDPIRRRRITEHLFCSQ